MSGFVRVLAAVGYDNVYEICRNYSNAAQFSIVTVEGKYHLVDEEMTDEKCEKINEICGNAKITQSYIMITGLRKIYFSDIDYFEQNRRGIVIYETNGGKLEYRLRNCEDVMNALKKYVRPRLAVVDYTNKCLRIPSRADDFIMAKGFQPKNIEIIRIVPFSSICNFYLEPMFNYAIISTVNGQQLRVFGLAFGDFIRRAEIELGNLGDIYTEESTSTVIWTLE